MQPAVAGETEQAEQRSKKISNWRRRGKDEKRNLHVVVFGWNDHRSLHALGKGGGV
jgi:hypothetical protein